MTLQGKVLHSCKCSEILPGLDMELWQTSVVAESHTRDNDYALHVL